MAFPRRVDTARLRPATCPGGEGSQDSCRESPVLRSSRENGVYDIVERRPPQFDVLLLLRGRVIGRGYREVAGKKYSDRLVASTRSGEEVQQNLPVLSRNPGFLQQLSPCRRDRIFVRDIKNARRQLPLTRADGVPVLSNQQHSVILIKGDDGDGAAMREVLTGQDARAVFHFVSSNVPDKSIQIGLGGPDWMVCEHIGELVGHSAVLLFLGTRKSFAHGD